VAWKCGVSPARARRLVLLARRLGELPETRSALEAGELCEDQVVLGSYPFDVEAKGRSH